MWFYFFISEYPGLSTVMCILRAGGETNLWLYTEIKKMWHMTCVSLVVTLANCFFIFNRAIYFAAYSTAKEKLNGVLEPDSTQVHMASAGMAG